jgi:transposase
LAGIVYQLRTGVSWRLLPTREFGCGCSSPVTCWQRLRDWQREEQAFKEAHRWARRAHRQASWALWCSGTGILVAVVALLTG